MLRIAKENCARVGLKGVDLVCSDAEQFTGYDECSFIYMFNPFPERVMQAVIRNLAQSLERRPRKITIIYLYPTQDQVVLSGPFHLVCAYHHLALPIHVYCNEEK